MSMTDEQVFREQVKRGVKFEFQYPTDVGAGGYFYIEKRLPNVDSEHKFGWAIVDAVAVFSKKELTFILEPQPSSRDAEFIQDTRFSFAEALDIALKIEEGTSL